MRTRAFEITLLSFTDNTLTSSLPILLLSVIVPRSTGGIGCWSGLTNELYNAPSSKLFCIIGDTLWEIITGPLLPFTLPAGFAPESAVLPAGMGLSVMLGCGCKPSPFALNGGDSGESTFREDNLATLVPHCCGLARTEAPMPFFFGSPLGGAFNDTGTRLTSKPSLVTISVSFPDVFVATNLPSASPSNVDPPDAQRITG